MSRLFISLTVLLLLSLACGLPAASTPPPPPTPAPATEPSAPTTATLDTETPNTETPNTETLNTETPYISFIINVHDWTHPAESADILLKLVDLFEKYGVRGDFYFTAEITRELAENHPEVIERFRNSNMTISYHVRPPHPLYNGFDARLQGLDKTARYQTLLDYETYALDLATGDLDRSQPGGYTYVAEVFGRKPVVVPGDQVYADLGGQMTVRYHEEGTKIEQPFEYFLGMLVRPSDFSVTRNTIIDGTDNFWWNKMSAPGAAEYHPLRILEHYMTDWEAHNYPRAPFITALIHENNFYRSGPEGWTSIYYTMQGGKKGDPLSPPFDLNAPDPSRPRTEADKAAIWQAYEELVAYAAANLNVVTSEEILRLAGSP